MQHCRFGGSIPWKVGKCWHECSHKYSKALARERATGKGSETYRHSWGVVDKAVGGETVS